MGRPGSPCREMGRPGGARAVAAAAAQDGGAATGPGGGRAGRGWWEWAGRRGRPGPRTSQPSPRWPRWPHVPRPQPPARRRRAAARAGSRTARSGRGRRRGPLGPAERGRHLLRDHPTDPGPGAQVFPLPPLLPGGPGAGLGQGAPRPRARPRPSDPLVPPRLVPQIPVTRSPQAGSSGLDPLPAPSYSPGSSSRPGSGAPRVSLGPHPSFRCQRLVRHTAHPHAREPLVRIPLSTASQPLGSA